MKKPTPTSSTNLDSAQIDAIVNGHHGDVFAVLGLHARPSKTGLLVRAMLPGASSVEVIACAGNRKVATLNQIHEAGLFEGDVPRRKNKFAYRLRVAFDDTVVEFDDAYQFAPQLSDDDLYLFCEGTQERLYRWMGAHPRTVAGVEGYQFVVWAPAASRVSVIADFNSWDGRRHMMRKHPASGVWEIFVPGINSGCHYKYEILDTSGKLLPLKADPFAFAMQHPPETASVTSGAVDYQWQDDNWLAARATTAHYCNKPLSIYEVHLGSWRRTGEQGDQYLSYRQLADELIPYVIELGFTHIQLMPVSEFPFDGSWGYQPIGLFAPTSRFGQPEDFKHFVDQCHANGIGVLLDWVPGHFPTDEHGLGRFDGTCLYEHEDVRKGFHPDWNTLIYNYSRFEVMSFLLSNAMFWLDEYHIDGLRVDAVASMLYLDYSREEGQWIPNSQGGRENLEAISLLQQVNSRVHFNFPGVIVVAEESTAWPGVTQTVDNGGLGFDFKWNMGWMNDTLRYVERDPIHRQYHHNEMTFGLVYSFSENFILPISHDEVVHGKGSLLEKMPGDDWQKFANVRAYLAYMWAHPGKKLLFMGSEFAQRHEWNHDQSLDWHELDSTMHRGVQNLVRDLNGVYCSLPALFEQDCDGAGFEWISADNNEQSIFAFVRKAQDAPAVVVLVNMAPQVHEQFKIGVPSAGHYLERINTDSDQYGGSNTGNFGGVAAQANEWQGFAHSIELTVPPLAALILEHQL